MGSVQRLHLRSVKLAEWIGAAADEGVVNGFLLCEYLEGAVAEFVALREDIFDFQFELVDFLARVVRGNVAKMLAHSIKLQQNDVFRADQLLGGFLMTQLFIQSQAWLYCYKLEYQNEGERVQPCSPETGLFTNSGLDNLHRTLSKHPIHETSHPNIPSKHPIQSSNSNLSITAIWALQTSIRLQKRNRPHLDYLLM